MLKANPNLITWRRVWPLCLMALLAALVAWLMTPRAAVAEPARLDTRIPLAFGHWKNLPDPIAQMSLVPQDDRSSAVSATYDEALMRTYGDAEGNRVMVAFAYGRNQRQEGKIHRPELCYVSQGFGLDHISSHALYSDLMPGRKIATKRLIMRTRDHDELVTYWIRIGDTFPDNAFESRLYLLGEGLRGRIPDGILFRVSQAVSADMPANAREHAFMLQEQFMLDLVQNLPAQSRPLLIGRG